jgi:hypothetical protein
MAKARPVKRDHTVFRRGQINQAAGLEVFDHAPVAVQEHQRHSRSSLDVVDASALDPDELSPGRVTSLSFSREPPIQDNGREGGCDNTSPRSEGPFVPQ